jgi:hypothetical protein
MNRSASFTSTVFSLGGLIAANSALLYHEPLTLASGQVLVRGAVLGKVTATGKYILSASAAVDGSEVPAAILVDDTNASAGDAAVLGYTRGDFLASGLTLGAGHTVASVRAAFKDIGIFISTDLGGV